MNVKLTFITGFLGLILICLAVQGQPDSGEIVSGHIYGANLESIGLTSLWGGLFGSLSSTELEVSDKPFHSFTVGSSSVYQVSNLPGLNLKNGQHYFGLLPINTSFNISKIRNVTISDLDENGLFNQTNFPHFHPNYTDKKDNANYTFCCSQKTFKIDGTNFMGFVITLESNIEYGLLKYQYNDTTAYPLFIVELDDYTCVGQTQCNYEFLVPYDKTYYFYALSKIPAYNITTYIDGNEGTTFQKPALPYNLTVRVTRAYGGTPVANITVAVIENNGNNLFVPLRLNGITSLALCSGKTDNNGYVQFIAVPTEYPEITGYSISVVLLTNDLQTVLKEKNLSIAVTGSISGEKKPLSPSELSNDGKVAVNTINSLVSSLYAWANIDGQALNHDITVYTNGTISPAQNELGTGAPNIIRVTLKDAGTQIPISGYVRIEEAQGWIVMHPPYSSESVIGSKTRLHREFYIPTGSYFLVSPTNNPPASSELYLLVYNSTYGLVGNFSGDQFNATNSISDEGTGVRGGYQTLNLNEFKTTINALASIGSNLYYALN